MVIVSISDDLKWLLSEAGGVIGQSPFKKISNLDILGKWKLTDRLNDLKTFEFTVKNDNFERDNIIIERDISVPLLTPFKGVITQRTPLRDSIKFKAMELAWHFTRRKYSCHDKRRIKFTQKDWFDKAWKQRRKIKLVGKKLTLSTGSDISNFPLLFKTTDIELKNHALSNGFDILFTITSTDGVITQLNHEIEKFTPSTGELVVFIKFPDLKSNQDINFEMYYSNPDSSNQQNPTGTWSGVPFNAIWHLHSDSLDSTSNNNDGTDTSITRVIGEIADSANFDAINSKIDVGTDATIDDIFAATNGGWVSCWINPNTDGEGDNGRILDKVQWDIRTNGEVGGKVKIQFTHTFSGVDGVWETISDIPLNKFTRIDVFYDNSTTSNNPTIYVNGIARTVALGTLTETGTPTMSVDSDAGSNLIIGNVTGQTATFDGEIDEVKIQKTPSSKLGEIIKIDFVNDKKNSDFFNIGQSEFLIKPADEIMESIISSANLDMPSINNLNIPNLVSLWKLNGDVTDSKGSNNGTWVGAELYEEGIFDQDKAAKFGGSSRINTADSPFDFDHNDPFSIHFIVKTKSTSDEIIISKRLDSVTASIGWLVKLVGSSGFPQFELSNGSTEFIVTGTTKINDGKFHQITVTYDGTSNQDGMKIYHDNFLEATGATSTITGVITNNLTFTLGAGDAGASALTGTIDDTRIYSIEITKKQIAGIFKMTQSGIDFVNQKIKWKLGDGKITEIPNLLSFHQFEQSLLDSKKTNDLTIVGTEKYSDSKFNKGLDLDGSTYANITNETDYDFERTDKFSFNFYFKGNTSATAEEVISKHNATVGYRLAFNASDELVFEMDDGTNSHTWTYTTDIRDNKLHKIGIVSDGSGASGVDIYVDGVIVSTTLAGTFPTATILNNMEVRIGATIVGADKLTAIIDDLRFYNRNITKLENKRLFEATDSGIDRVRDDDISTKLLEIDFNHKNHLQSFQKISKEIGTDIWFDSNNFIVYLREKGKKIQQVFDRVEVVKPSFDLSNVSNVINILGNTVDGIQREKTVSQDTKLKYIYEETFGDNQITTDQTLEFVGDTLLSQFKDLNPDLIIVAPYDQFVKFDLKTGDKLKINEIEQDLQGEFRITQIITEQNRITLTLTTATKALIPTTGKSVSNIISTLIRNINDIQTQPEQL